MVWNRRRLLDDELQPYPFVLEGSEEEPVIVSGGHRESAHLRLRLVFYEPLPGTNRTDVIDINPDVTSLRWSTSLPGGYNGLEFGLGDPRLPSGGIVPRPIRIRPHGRVQVWDGSFLCFEGRVERGVGPRGMFGGSGVGYGIAGANDGFYSSTSATSVSALTLFRSVFASAAPLLRVGGDGQTEDSGALHTYAEMDQLTPAVAAEQLGNEGGVSDGGYQVWDYWVYENRIVYFLARDIPDRPDYIIPFDEDVEWIEEYGDMYSAAAVSYTIAGTEQTPTVATNAVFEGRWGFSRTALIPGGEMTSGLAANVRSTFLRTHSEPQYSITVSRSDERGMELYAGGERPCHQVRASEWVRIGLGEQGAITLPIVATEYDAFTRTARYELGIPNPDDSSEFTANVARETSLLKRFINPFTFTRHR